jgi:molybdenum cofactor cytidylyltransferase
MQPVPPISFGALVLGAGGSTRMGQPKLLLPWRENNVIGHIIQTWRNLGVCGIAIVTRPDDTALAAELDRQNIFPTQRIENSNHAEGMFSSVLCAAKWAAQQTEISHWAIILGDQPHLRSEDLRSLVDLQAQNRAAICQLMCGGKTGHPVMLPHSLIQELAASTTDTLKDFLKLTVAPRVQLEVSDAGLLLDMDTPDDYKRLTASP